MRNKNQQNNKEINNYQKRGFIKNLPFGVKATFIKYWFYGAVYFFVFMGLGLFLKDDSILSATAGVLAGVLFDIAVYNIFLLFAETREEASKWWFFKSKKFYSFLLNIVFEVGLFFLYHLLVILIKLGLKDRAQWFLQEPLTAALLLITLDTGLVWLKNLIFKLIKKIFDLTDDALEQKVSSLKVIDVSPVSATIELTNLDKYYSLKPFNVFLDNELIMSKVKTNIFTIFDLKPDTQYKVTINRKNITFTTSKILKFYKVFEGNDIQDIIDNADQYSLIIINKGNYKIKSLSLKNNLTLYIRKDAVIKVNDNPNDYPIIPSYYPSNKTEVYGNYLGEASKMRQSIFHIDHVKNLKIIGEGIIDSDDLLSAYKSNDEDKIIPPHLMFINHSSNVSIIGLTLKNSPQSSINSFFSNNINFININIDNNLNSNRKDGIIADCSSNINVLGSMFSICNNAIAVKSGKLEIAEKYHVASKEINIRNCLIENVNSAITLGNEISSGVYSIKATQCLINKSLCGVLVKTNLNRGKDAIIKDININDITMDNVVTPIIINTYDEYTSKSKFIDKSTIPFINNFTFNNITANDYELTPGYFIGFIDKYIGEVNITNSSFIAKTDCKEGYPLTIKEGNKLHKNGFIVKNVRLFNLKKVNVNNNTSKKYELENVSEAVDD